MEELRSCDDARARWNHLTLPACVVCHTSTWCAEAITKVLLCLVMDSLTAFAAVGLAAVSWDSHFTPAGTRAFRHALDYREPFCQMSDGEMIALLDDLLDLRRSLGAHEMMLKAAKCLTNAQCMTAYAMASELMRSDGPFEPEERRFLDHLAVVLEISKFEAQRIDAVFEIFHARLTLSSTLEMNPVALA